MQRLPFCQRQRLNARCFISVCIICLKINSLNISIHIKGTQALLVPRRWLPCKVERTWIDIIVLNTYAVKSPLLAPSPAAFRWISVVCRPLELPAVDNGFEILHPPHDVNCNLHEWFSGIPINTHISLRLGGIFGFLDLTARCSYDTILRAYKHD